MNRKMERPVFIHDLDPLTQGSTLVVGINTKGKISRFNETLEQLTGTSKKDVLDVSFSSYFSKQIPKDELEKLLRQAQYTPESVDIDTTFQTVSGENVVVNWTGFAIKDGPDGRVSQLNLVGIPKQTVSSAPSKSGSSNQSSSSKKQGSTTTKSSKKEKKKQDPQKTTTEEDTEQTPTKSQDKVLPASKKEARKERSTTTKSSKKEKKKQEPQKTTTEEYLEKDRFQAKPEQIDEAKKKESTTKPFKEEKKNEGPQKTKTEEDTEQTPTKSQDEVLPASLEENKDESSLTKPVSFHDEGSNILDTVEEKHLKKNVKKPLTKKKIRIKRRPSFSKKKIPKDEAVQEDPVQVIENAGSMSTPSQPVEQRNEPSEPGFVKKLFQTPSFKKKTKRTKPSRSIPKKLPFSKTKKLSQPAQKTMESNKSNEEYPSLQQTITALENEKSLLQKQIKHLEKDLQTAELKKEELKEFFNSTFRFIRDSVGIKKKREEFQLMMQQLNERKQKLETLETEMVLEKKEFKQKIEEFVAWREKLESLEQEIEKRRQFLSEQESFLNEQYDKVLSHELMQPASYTQSPDNTEEKSSSEEPGILEKEDLFNALTVEAAVLQRGRIKKANKLFAQMLGYSEDELVGKHLVDFVGPNGLAGVEQHYMNRLKGVDDSSYHTVFLSKDDTEVTVKVHVKTGDFQGERAEIATFNEM